MPMVFQADWILSPGAPPLPQGWMRIEGDTIVEMGSGPEVSGTPIRFPGCALLPGLVNAHCHLELSGLEGRIPSAAFPEWVGSLQKATAGFTLEDYREASASGLSRLLSGGTTSVLDVGNSGEALPVLKASPLRGHALLEVLGLDPDLAEERFSRAVKIIGNCENVPSRLHAGLAIHAVYSCSPELTRSVAWHQQSRHLPFPVHVSESCEETELFQSGSGALQNFCRGIYSGTPEYRNTTPLQVLAQQQSALPKRTLAVHGNHLSESDFSLLAKQDAFVVHCPSSHAFFGHRPFPLARLRDHGIRVCLGTDSLASGNSLSMLDQMHRFRKAFPELAPTEILGLATENGAAALGLEKIGRLQPGWKADIIAVRCAPRFKDNPCEGIFDSESAVVFCAIEGREVSAPREPRAVRSAMLWE